MATASPLSSTLSNQGASLDTASSKLQHTPSPRKLKRLQSAYTNNQHSESKCKRCGWQYPITKPNSRQRRHHKKICPKRSSLGSDEEIEISSGHGGPDQSESEGSTLTAGHELTDTAKSRRSLHFGDMEKEMVTQREVAQKDTERAVNNELEQGPSDMPERGRDDKPTQGSSEVPTDSGHHGSGPGKEVEGFKDKNLGSQSVRQKEPEEAHSPRESDEGTGSDSGVSSAAGDHETDPSDDMGFESSDLGEVAKREDSLPSDDDMLEEVKKYGAMQHKHPHAHLKGVVQSSHRPDSEAEGRPVKVADLITKYEKGKGSSANLPSDITSDDMALAGAESSTPANGSGQLSLRRKDQVNVGEIIPAEEILEEGRLSASRGVEYDLKAILKKQKTHDLICPMCGSEITNRIILRKKSRTFVSKNEAERLPKLTEISSEVPDQEYQVKALTAGSQGTWVDRCFGYLGLFRRNS